jgi:DNA-binding MarR family transcriptional regulator
METPKDEALVADRDAVLALVRMAEEIGRGLSEGLRPFRLTLSQYRVLRVLRRAGEEGLACREIAERLVPRDPDVTRLLDRLETRGLVTRRRDRPDRRVVRTRLTEEGLRVLERLDELVERLHTRYLGQLGSAALGALNTALKAAGHIS